jgi:hypothetical protein
MPLKAEVNLLTLYLVKLTLQAEADVEQIPSG